MVDDARRKIAVAELSLAHKLKLKPGLQAAILNAPADYLVELAPERVSIDHILAGKYDWIQVFVNNRTELEHLLPAVIDALKPVSILWVSFPKATSGIQTDLTRDQGWDTLTELKRINLVSINLTWSAFSMRPFKTGKKQGE